jgi:sporulation protein YlmC with PRC-barrel domain
MRTKVLALALAGTALLSWPALAQSNQSTTSAPANPPATTAAPGGIGNWMTQEQPGQWRASKLKGVNIYNNNNESIGEVEELIVGQDGKVTAAIIGIGGFLGIGQHDVAVPFNEIQWVMEPRAVATNTAPPAATAPATTAPAGTTAPRTADATRPADANAPAATGSAATRGATAVPADRANRSYPDHGILSMSRDQLKAAPEFHYAR